MKVASIASSLALVLLGAAVQHTQAEESCIVFVVNHAYDGLTVNSYDQDDTACLIPYETITTNSGNVAEFECQGVFCKIKVAGALNCGGAAEVDCFNYMVYYTNKDGALTYCLSDDETCEPSSRRLVHDQEPEPSKAAHRLGRRYYSEPVSYHSYSSERTPQATA